MAEFIVTEETNCTVRARTAAAALSAFLGSNGIGMGPAIIQCTVPERDVFKGDEAGTWIVSETAEYTVEARTKAAALKRFLSEDGVQAGTAITQCDVYERRVEKA